jgi:hypothetical protein
VLDHSLTLRNANENLISISHAHSSLLVLCFVYVFGTKISHSLFFFFGLFHVFCPSLTLYLANDHLSRAHFLLLVWCFVNAIREATISHTLTSSCWFGVFFTFSILLSLLIRQATICHALDPAPRLTNFSLSFAFSGMDVVESINDLYKVGF